MHRVPGSCAVVIFGGLGDLAGRKLVPALYNLYLRRLLPAGFAVIGIGRTDPGGDEGYRAAMRKTCEEFSRTPVTDAGVGRLRRAAELGHRHVRRRRRPTQRCRSASARSRPSHGTAGNVLFYLSVPPSQFPVDRRRARRAPASRPRTGRALPPRRDREAVRRTTWPARAALNDERAPRLRRAPDLPHRPLPGQGDGPEHPRLPVRQRHLRAGLEPPATSTTCRSRWPRRSASRAAARFYEEAGALRDMVQNHMLQVLCARGDGAAGVVRRRGRARREGARCCASVPAAAADVPTSCAASTRPGIVDGKARAAATARRRASRPTPTPRPTSRRALAHRQLALGRRAVLPAHRQAAAEARHRDRDPVQARAAPAVLVRRGRAARAERAGAAHPAGRGHLAALRRQGARPSASRSAP